MIAVGPEFFGTQSRKEAREKETFPDGPPCLNHLAKVGVPVSGGNTVLVNIATYFKKSMPSGWENATTAANQSILTTERTFQEVENIIKSLTKKDYNYQCSQEPLKSYCDRGKCHQRKFGVGSGENSFPILGNLRKLDSDPPTYHWYLTVSGQDVTIEFTDAQVQCPREFRRRVWQKTSLAVPILKQNVWDKHLNDLKKDGKVQVITLPPDATTEGQAWELIEQFCTRNEGDSEADMLLGRPWTDPETNRTHFRLNDVLRFMLSQQFKDYKIHQLGKLMRSKKAKDQQTNVKGKNFNTWSLPAFQKQTEPFDVSDSLKDPGNPF